MGQNDIALLLPAGLADYALRITVSVSRFLCFRSLKVSVVLPDGVTLGRRATPV